jgi:hypothetical protein
VARIPCASVLFAVVGFVGAGCGFQAPGASTAGPLDDTGTSFPIDSGGDDVAFDVERDTLGDTSHAETIDSAPIDGATDTRRDDVSFDAPPDGPAPCAEVGAIRYGDHCYFLILDGGADGSGVDFPTAQADCAAASPPAHLATMNVPGEHSVLDALCDSGFHCWVDLTTARKSKSAGDFHWDTGETGFDGSWCSGFPNDNGLCGAWYETPPGCYEDLDCATLQTHVVCERD